MNMETLHDLLLRELRGQYYTETELVDALDRLADQTAVNMLDESVDPELRSALEEAFADHREETETHVRRLEDVFEVVDRQPEARSVSAVEGVIADKEEFTNVVLNDSLRILYYLHAGMKIEQLEIETYESLVANAEALGLPDDAVDALEANLRDERDALEELERIADSAGIEDLREELGAASPEP